MVVPSSGKQATPALIVIGGPPVGVGRLGDRAPDPLGDLVGGEAVGARQDRGELVAAVAVERGRRRGSRRPSPRRSSTSSASPAGWPQRVVERLERVEIEHEDRERRPRPPLDRLAELALERAVVAQAGQRVLLGPHPDLAVGLGVLERDRRLAGEELGELELVVA